MPLATEAEVVEGVCPTLGQGGFVVQVDLDAVIGEAFCADLLGGTWKRTSYSGNYRTRYAGIGYTYDADLDAFITPQPYPSWALDQGTEWQPPVSYPDDGEAYEWDEATTSWVERTE